MSLIVAGERSGVGKTTVTLALLSYLKWQNLQVQSFKVGPDYIDPMFHQYVTGKSCRNLDPVLTSEVYVQQCFARNIQDVDFALVEGVMGLFDGVGFYPPSLERGVEDES
ncbi:MAG: cobyrinic acid a,c-diamide synthase, partial [Okeania sp. SIO2D1]|nr:cobyrinic acid a,c-diamide synthase [Okeania sp. SIO2D1]